MSLKYEPVSVEVESCTDLAQHLTFSRVVRRVPLLWYLYDGVEVGGARVCAVLACERALGLKNGIPLRVSHSLVYATL